MASKRPKPKKSKLRALEKATEAAKRFISAVNPSKSGKGRGKKRPREESPIDSSGYLTEDAQRLTLGEGILNYNFIRPVSPDRDSEKSPSDPSELHSVSTETQLSTPDPASIPVDDEDGFISLEAGDEGNGLAQRFAEAEEAEKEQLDAEARNALARTPQPLVVAEIPIWPSPWHSPKKVQAQTQGCKIFLDQVNFEIREYMHYITPLREEMMRREDCVKRVQFAVRKLWPGAQAHVFGSFATELYLPGADVDMVVVSPDRQLGIRRREMFRLSDRIRRNGWADRVDVISHARVPIIKFIDKATQLNVDISFEVLSGLDAVRTVNAWIKAEPAVKPLAMIVKQFLRRRKLNEVVHGGLGGYATVCMVVAFLKSHRHIRGRRIRATDNIGLLLLEFFILYGQNFDYSRYALNMTGNMQPILKRSNVNLETKQADGLAIQDPNDPNNNVSRSSYNFAAVRRSFSHAADLLRRLCADWMKTTDTSGRASMSFLAPLLKYTEAEAEIDRSDKVSPQVSKSRFSPPPQTQKPAPPPNSITKATVKGNSKGIQATSRPGQVSTQQTQRKQALSPSIPTEPASHRNQSRPSSVVADPFEPASTSSSSDTPADSLASRIGERGGQKTRQRSRKRARSDDDGSDADSRTKVAATTKRNYWQNKATIP